MFSSYSRYIGANDSKLLNIRSLLFLLFPPHESSFLALLPLLPPQIYITSSLPFLSQFQLLYFAFLPFYFFLHREKKGRAERLSRKKSRQIFLLLLSASRSNFCRFGSEQYKKGRGQNPSTAVLSSSFIPLFCTFMFKEGAERAGEEETPIISPDNLCARPRFPLMYFLVPLFFRSN